MSMNILTIDDILISIASKKNDVRQHS